MRPLPSLVWPRATLAAAVLAAFLLAALLLTEAHQPPRPALANPGVASISAGFDHTCAVTPMGGVKCWGTNSAGELGDGTTSNAYVPVDVVGLSSGVSAVNAGGSYTCALTTSGGVKCWGSNYHGKLGDGTTTNRTTPIDVFGLTSGVTAVTTGADHTCALTSSGGVKCWGSNYFGNLGNGKTTGPELCNPPYDPCSMTPVDVVGLSSGVTAVTAGNEHTCALTASGTVKCWGWGFHGQLGTGTYGAGGAGTSSSTPVYVCEESWMPPVACTAANGNILTGVAAISAGGTYNWALMTSGAVKCWGSTSIPVCGGVGGITTDVPGLQAGILAIDAGGSACAVTVLGGLKCAGNDDWGQLGDGDPGGAGYPPVAVVGLSSGVTAVTAGNGYTCALTNASGVKCWGINGYGQLGDGMGRLLPYYPWFVSSATPVDVCGLGPPMPKLDGLPYCALAAHWAPVIYQDTDSTCPAADYITNVDFDGNWNGLDNWNHLSCSASNLNASVYYWVVETENNWFIGYSFFHPRDWGEYVLGFYTIPGCVGPPVLCNVPCIPDPPHVQACDTGPECPPLDPGGTLAHLGDKYACHENDFEGILLVIQKDGSPYGQFLLMGTRFHHEFRWYKDDDNSPSMDISGYDFSDDCDADPLTTCSDVDFEVNQPIAYSQAKTHAVVGSLEWENGGFPGGDGVVYVGYALPSIQDLWDRRCPPYETNETFKSWGVLRGDDGGDDAANAPWGQGGFFGLSGDAFFLDPAFAIAANFDWIENPLLINYVGASFETNGCVHESAGVGVAATFENVTTPGTTTATASTSGAAAPAGFQPGTSGIYYDVSTIATFSGNVELCFDYAESTFTNEAGLHVFHYENDQWLDVTTNLSTVDDRICGVVTSFSPFLIAELIPTEDYDLDGCTNSKELGSLPAGGGLRDPQNFWDFFDTPKPNIAPLRDKVVDLNDIIRIAGRFATVGNPNGDPLSSPPKTGYHTAYDRTLVGPDPYDLGPPDGVIGLNEIYWAAKQFAHNCT